jgi:hypothetical protein
MAHQAELKRIDEEIAEAIEEGYLPDIDRLLEERRKLTDPTDEE